MEEMASLWNYQESIEDLKQKLLYATLELESIRMEASEEMKKDKEYVKHLLQLLKIACHERDEARDQLQKLLKKDCNGTMSTIIVPSGTPKIDQTSLLISKLVKGKTLPQKGKLLQAVLEAGPLLQTLLVAGPLPRWRNPPPLQPFQIPLVSIKGCDAELVTQKPASNPGHFIPKSLNSSSYIEMPCGSSQMSSSSMLNFGSGHSGSCLGNGRMISAGANTDSYIATGKRQRLQ
ncbi:hypothetical protein F0562_001275 [Nyssa sinensis]|uniref:Uncharacterized protein n=1 Tax=Nyssa sinensis TaxID=561372 RepID=A0A5J5C740_9ASTE|nr:hypothetical protein F0562_001275 [Nyssa sinensis]